MKIFTVTEITHYLRKLLESDAALSDLSIKGEISNFSESLAGHCYFTLKDSESQLRCVLFRGMREKIRLRLKEGLKVVVRGRMTVYPRQGHYQLVVESVKEEGLGDLYEKFLKLKEKLHHEGMFDERHKVPIPYFPHLVGVVTSPYGAAVHDIIITLRRRNDAVGIVLAPVLVQGDEAPESICAGLRKIQKVPGIEVIILGRGGGSFEELMAFSDERVARVIYDCKIPVISAVGHETDFSISDLVADVRAATPTAAAQIAAPEKEKLAAHLQTGRIRMERAMTKLLQHYRWQLESIRKRYVFRFPARVVQTLSQNLDMLFSRLVRAEESFMEAKKSRHELLGEKLRVYNPFNILEKGYSITCKMPENILLASIGEVKSGDELRIIVKDGELDAEVKATRQRNNNLER